MSTLHAILKKAKSGWSYLWNLLKKEVQRKNIKPDVLMELYRYQIVLDSTKHILDLFEEELKDKDLPKEEQERINDALSRHITNFQAIAFSIENLLRE